MPKELDLCIQRNASPAQNLHIPDEVVPCSLLQR